jgi:hypothetical protein
MKARLAAFGIATSALLGGCSCDCVSSFAIAFDTTLNAYSADVIADDQTLSFEFSSSGTTITDGDLGLVAADGSGFAIEGQPASVEVDVFGTDPVWNTTGLWAPVWDEAAADRCGCIEANAQLGLEG